MQRKENGSRVAWSRENNKLGKTLQGEEENEDINKRNGQLIKQTKSREQDTSHILHTFLVITVWEHRTVNKG